MADLKRKTTYKQIVPATLPTDCDRVTFDIDPNGATGEQVVVTFYKNDGTRVVKKGNIPALTETGANLTLA